MSDDHEPQTPDQGHDYAYDQEEHDGTTSEASQDSEGGRKGSLDEGLLPATADPASFLFLGPVGKE